MTDTGGTAIFHNYVDRILQQATPSTNDTRFASYVRYVNEFLKFFGTEQCFLVGSCAEKTKLTWSKDDGDADFLMVSGKLSIPVEEIEARPDNPDFVWIRGEHLNIERTLKTGLTEGDSGKKYLPATVLRDVDPTLFTILRGVLKFISRTTDSFPSERTNDRKTTTGATSKVGLERTQFRKLTIIDNDKIPHLRKYIPKRLPLRKSKKNEKHSPRNSKNFETLFRALELFALFSNPGTNSEHESEFEHFANVVRLLLNRWKAERDPQSLVSLKDIDSEDENAFSAEHRGEDTTLDNTEDEDFERFVNDLDFPSNVKATYKEKFMTDFVPALRVEGKLKCMEDWYNRNGNWPSARLREEMYNSDCYVIAKTAPFEEDQRDFCLAFNHAELKLAKALTPTQRTCYLLLKAYHKGIFEKIMEKIPTKHPLKTFHLKTVFYWVLENTGDTSMWWEENLVEALRSVVMYLKEALLNRTLKHYFTGANLFLCFETSMCLALITEIDKILDHPVECLQRFFDLENQGDIEVTLTDDQVQCLIEMSRDGGVEKEASIIEDIMEDFMRGFREAPKDANGDISIKQAMDHVIKVVLEDETKRRMKALIRKQRTPQTKTLADIPSRSMSGLLAKVVPKQDCHVLTEDAKKEEKCVRSDNDQGNTETFRHDRVDLGQQLAEAASAFVFNPLSTNDRKSLEGNLKQKGFSYFLEEPPD